MSEASVSNSQHPVPNRGFNIHKIHSSCDRCRSRKTKCIDPIPGPCRYCSRTGATCKIATPRRKRPYYHVTEEEYQCSLRIVGYFFPNRELDLQSLRSIAKEIGYGKLTTPSSQQTQTPLGREHIFSRDEDCPQGAEPVVESINDLHESLGCMMEDSRGKFRYVGAHSEIPFNAAVCSLGDVSQTDSNIIGPPKVGSYPPALSTPSPSLDESASSDRYYLPPRESCDYYISSFLEDIHCTYWFYPIEMFLNRVDSTYSASATATTSSWMCSLYSIFAIGAANDDEEDAQSPPRTRSPYPGDEKTSDDYIVLAKQLTPAVYDEADIDSIRGLAIMSIALENLCSRLSSYLYMGASIQIAYSLGLHRDQLPGSGGSMEREQNRRIWWTLFTLDQEIASRGGSPTLIDERSLKISTLLPYEQILYPGIHTPLSWLATMVSLSRLKREIIQAVYTECSTTTRTISFSTISTLLLSLQKWHQLIPPHLRHDVPVPPTHRRAVAVLHLHYWGSTILLCRPFLLYVVLKHSTLGSSKKIWFERMGKTCIDAAQKSIAILQQMAVEDTLSSLTTLDCTCLLRLIMIFILAYAHTKLQQYRSSIEAGIALLRGMRQIGFCRMVTEETPLRLADLGIVDGGNEVSDDDVLLDDDIIAQLWGNLDPNFTTSLQSHQSFDLVFDDASSFDLNSEILQFTNLDDSIVIDPSHVYANFDLQ